MLNTAKIGLLGLGTVGGGTINVLQRNAAELTRRVGRDIRVTHASARNLNKARICDTTGIQLTTDPMAVVCDPDVDIIAELIGGVSPARELVLAAINNGKHVVTANKALIALHGNELFEAAQAKGVMIAFEAAVAGGIPIVKAIREGLSGNRINWLAGIINGTSNFILTEMREKQREFADILREAQALGYAEADPTFDVEGIDAAHKLAILASIAFGIPLQFERVYTEGIARLTPMDVAYADELGYCIKHLGIARRAEDGIELRVHPTLIPQKHPLANVDGVMNAVLVQGDVVGPTLYCGAGAGSEPTASAVVADLVDIIRTLTTDPDNRVPHLAFQPDALSDLPILLMEQVPTAYYLRMMIEDRVGVLASIAAILSEKGISIEVIVQKEPEDGASHVPLVILTHKVMEQCINQAIQQMEQLGALHGQVARLRMETLD